MKGSTVLTYGATSVVMDCNPLLPRNVSEKKAHPCEFDSDGNPYAYDPGSPRVRSESLMFPAISFVNLQELLDFIDYSIAGGQHPFTWYDHGTTRQARYAGLNYQPVSIDIYQAELTLEVYE